jgi:hypothetical protein
MSMPEISRRKDIEDSDLYMEYIRARSDDSEVGNIFPK